MVRDSGNTGKLYAFRPGKGATVQDLQPVQVSTRLQSTRWCNVTLGFPT